MKLKSLIVGFIAGAFAATALTAGASTIYEKYTATARPDYKIVVDGQEVKLNNPPKIIEGSTHLPVKELASILNKEATFNNGIIEITTKEGNEGESMSTENKTEALTNEWISVFELKQSHTISESTKLPDGHSVESEVRIYTVTIDGKKYEFEIPRVVFGDMTFTNQDGIELRYIDGNPYLKRELF